jgi:hypothetical protein
MPYLFGVSWRTRMGCGAGALALLTGIVPEVIAKKNGSTHYSDDFMLRFLRAHGFSTLQLTWCNVSVGESKIGNEHVLLLSQLFAKNEATWVVMHNELCYHNFDVYSATTLSFLNRPLLSAYLVIHPIWRVNRAMKGKQVPKLKVRDKRLRLAALGERDNSRRIVS